jgi:hypothetical protein
MIDFDLEKAIKAIDRKIHELEQAKEVLIESFGVKNVSAKPLTLTAPPKLPSPARRNLSRRPPSPPPIFTRKQQIIELLKKEGPLSRVEIEVKTGIPQGSIATALIDKAHFRSENGKWTVVGRATPPVGKEEAQPFTDQQ